MMDLDRKHIRETLLSEFAEVDLERVLECLEGSPNARSFAPHHEPTRLYFPGLRAKGWWDTSEIPALNEVERAYPDVLAELQALDAAEAQFYPYEDPYTMELGWRGWTTFCLYRKGRDDRKNAPRCPQTLQAIGRTPRGLRLGMFAKLAPRSHIEPHTGGINVMLTCHLGLDIPESCAIRVGSEVRSWEEGKCLVFDDSFIHEAWNRGIERTRVVLLWDVWHPDLTPVEIAAMKIIFPYFDRAMRGSAYAAEPAALPIREGA